MPRLLQAFSRADPLALRHGAISAVRSGHRAARRADAGRVLFAVAGNARRADPGDLPEQCREGSDRLIREGWESAGR